MKETPMTFDMLSTRTGYQKNEKKHFNQNDQLFNQTTEKPHFTVVLASFLDDIKLLSVIILK